MLQTKKISGPPAYFTYDWDAAYQSVEKLALLYPETVATGHGKPMSGDEMREELINLYENFYEEVVPESGRYTDDPAVTDASGVIYVPSKYQEHSRINWWAVGAALALTTAVFVLISGKQKKWYQRT